jgi:hypothetical protein
MHKQKAVALTRKQYACISAIGVPSSQTKDMEASGIMANNGTDWLNGSLAKWLGPVNHTAIDDEVIVSSSDAGVHIIYKAECTPTSDDVEFIVRVLKNQSEYIRSATEFVANELRANPHDFDIDPADVDKIIANSPVREPEFIFRLDGAWEIHFTECKFGNAEECGVLVCFDGDSPTHVEDLTEADAWYDPDSKEWVDY